MRVGPALSALFHNRALALLDMGKLDEAKATLDMLRVRFPQNPRALSFRSELFCARQQYDSMSVALDQPDRIATDGADQTRALMLQTPPPPSHEAMRRAMLDSPRSLF